ncbi:MAG TPA: TonB-dependent receptor [Chitinophagaceae bacterium]|nr:TonB-dependent receptor [Chitinophagaceae bacterium]
MRYLILLCLTAFSLLPAAAQPCNLTLLGHVHHGNAHENLQGATITLVELSRSTITDEQGNFRFDSLCAGPVTLRISHVPFDTVVRAGLSRRVTHLDIDLHPNMHLLEEVVVSAHTTHGHSGRTILSGKELEETRGRSLGEALSKINGVSLLQTGSTISKPVIHGLHGSRILMINNGVRQEGQQWGSEHAPEIDPYIAGRLTVIKGVDELRYGSDAVGGVVLVEPRPLRTQPGYSGEVNAGYFSNNRQYTASAQWEQQWKRFPSFTYRVQGTFRKGANVRTPGYRLNNTGLEEQNFSLTGAWRKGPLSSELFYSFFDTKVGIFTGAHIGNLTDLQKAIESPQPDPVFTGQQTYRIGRPYQSVRHQLVKSRTSFSAGQHRFHLLLAGQWNDREEFDIVRSSRTTRPQLDLSIRTLSEEVSWDHVYRGRFSGTFGLTAQQQQNSYAGRYLVPAYRAGFYGAYYIGKWSRDRWEAQAGLRYDDKSIQTHRLQAGGATFDHYRFRFSTLGTSAHVGYRLTEHWKVAATAALSTRAPQVNELLSNGIHHGTATYEEGNIHLKPERSLNLAVSSVYQNNPGTLSVELSLYHNRIRDFIYQQPVPDEPVLTIAGAFPKLAYRQTDAVLQGGDLSLTLRPAERWEWTGSYMLLRARNEVQQDWLIGMPADRIRQELTRYLADGRRFSQTYFSLETVHQFRQTRTPDERLGKQDYKEAPAGYLLLNADLSTTVRLKTLPLTIGLSGRNLLNRKYRDYLNSLRYFTDEPGRNLQVRIKLPLSFNHQP